MTDSRTGALEFETFDPVIDLGTHCAEIAHDAGLLALLAELYGEPAVLFKDKLIYKPAGCLGYNLHQDFVAWRQINQALFERFEITDDGDAVACLREPFKSLLYASGMADEDGVVASESHSNPGAP